MIETCCLKNVVIFIETILSFVLSKKMSSIFIYFIYIYILFSITIFLKPKQLLLLESTKHDKKKTVLKSNTKFENQT